MVTVYFELLIEDGIVTCVTPFVTLKSAVFSTMFLPFILTTTLPMGTVLLYLSVTFICILSEPISETFKLILFIV